MGLSLMHLACKYLTITVPASTQNKKKLRFCELYNFLNVYKHITGLLNFVYLEEKKSHIEPYWANFILS